MADTQVWDVDRAKKMLEGRTITFVRRMSPMEADQTVWGSCPIMIQLDDGTILYPATNDRSESAALLGNDRDGNEFVVGGKPS